MVSRPRAFLYVVLPVVFACLLGAAGAVSVVYGTNGGNPIAIAADSSGRMMTNGSGATQPVSGTFWQSNQPVTDSTVSSNLTTLGSQTTKINDGVNTAAVIPGGAPAINTATSSETITLSITGTQPASTAIPITATQDSARNPTTQTYLDCTGYQSATIQATSIGTVSSGSASALVLESPLSGSGYLATEVLSIASTGATAASSSVFSTTSTYTVTLNSRYLEITTNGAQNSGQTTTVYVTLRAAALSVPPSSSLSNTLSVGSVSFPSLYLQVLPSAAKTSTYTSGVENTNQFGFCRMRVTLNVTAASGTGGLQLQVLAYDPGSATYYPLNALPTAVTATGLYVYEFNPGSVTPTLPTGVTTWTCYSVVAPPQFEVKVTAGDSSSYTYSIGTVQTI